MADDELARTATADTGAIPSTPGPALGAMLGRYKLENPIGEGGMGVVHAALDPDLERRVALKVLRTIDDVAARQRLLREARALARLTHANVVAVHEVGSADGRDYIAMELVEGQTLGQWLKQAHRSQHDIIDAFVAAGRGLAAAHAAGLVHRDFKPHNVLRGKDGRIVVTDFGLACGVELGEAVKPTERASLTGLTATGSLLGTPAYMAPEQWSGGVIGPAADQFAFCVGMWEALTDERPFRGDTIDALKAQTARGGAALDASKLPRRLRRPLVRGLDPDPTRRWPSMDALLDALLRAERRPGVALAIGGGALAIALGVVMFVHGRGDDCRAPALSPASVWSAAKAQALQQAGQGPAAEMLGADFARWGDARARACRADTPAGVDRLACLDGVLARIDGLARAVAAVQHVPPVDPGDHLVDPAVCDAPHPPRLVATLSTELVGVLTAQLEAAVSPAPVTADDAAALVKRTTGEPCASAAAHVIASQVQRTTPDRKRHLAEAESAAEQCGDDRFVADLAFVTASQAISTYEPDAIAKLKRAEIATQRVEQADLRAALDRLRAELAQRNDHIDEAIARLALAAEGYRARGRLRIQIRDEIQLEELRQVRARREDLADTPKRLSALRALAVAKLGATDIVVNELDRAAADWMFANGDVAGAHALLVRARRDVPNEHPMKMSGRVVDEHGAPVAGAVVTAGITLSADSVGLWPSATNRSTASGADGTFTLAEAPGDGVIIAELGDRRSPAAVVADGVKLALEPTSRIEGKVDLKGELPQSVILIARAPDGAASTRWNVLAPVQSDGSFVVAGVPRGHVRLHAQIRRATTPVTTGADLQVTEPVMRGVQIAVAASKRAVHVIVRSTAGLALTSAQVVVMPGVVESTNAAELNRTVRDLQQRTATPVEGEHAPQAVVEAAKPGDVYATFGEAPEGTSSACAIGLPTEVTDPDLDRKVLAHLDKIEVRCKPIGDHDQVVVVEVPPWPRFD